MQAVRPEPVECLEPGLRRVLADNPSPMTHWGTNTYIVGTGRVAVIDPGPNDAGHLRAILAALGRGERVSHILITHSHMDHSALARPLACETGAPVLAFGNSLAGRSAVMNALAARGQAGGGEGVDSAFEPDEVLTDGQLISGHDWALRALWTPGHLGNHLCFAWNGAVCSGDHIMGWASTFISPPDGDLTAFMASTTMLAGRTDRVFYPGHGAPVHDPTRRVRWLLDHRRRREAAIMQVLADEPSKIAALTARIYTDVKPSLLRAAARNVFAHLIDLVQHSRVVAVPKIACSAEYSLA
ncbi:MBL fold metallo-hydrolase [Rhodobacteraceae bacterium R_SAG10]|nr:MBL fold metallo-hydrolase [Rhodobacteraceae bacterium R_SAG10]